MLFEESHDHISVINCLVFVVMGSEKHFFVGILANLVELVHIFFNKSDMGTLRDFTVDFSVNIIKYERPSTFKALFRFISSKIDEILVGMADLRNNNGVFLSFSGGNSHRVEAKKTMREVFVTMSGEPVVREYRVGKSRRFLLVGNHIDFMVSELFNESVEFISCKSSRVFFILFDLVHELVVLCCLGVEEEASRFYHEASIGKHGEIISDRSVMSFCGELLEIGGGGELSGSSLSTQGNEWGCL